MKIIFRLDTDDARKIDKFTQGTNAEVLVIPQGEHIRVYVVSDIGEVTELK